MSQYYDFLRSHYACLAINLDTGIQIPQEPAVSRNVSGYLCDGLPCNIAVFFVCLLVLFYFCFLLVVIFVVF